MHCYTNVELVDILLIYGEANYNCSEAIRLYKKRFPERVISIGQFQSIPQRLRDKGNLFRGKPGGTQCARVIPDIEENILEIVENDPCVSAREIGRRVGIAPFRVTDILEENMLHPYWMRPVQMLSVDYFTRLQFCEWLLEHCASNERFLYNILVCGEVQFTLEDMKSFQNTEVWSIKNPEAVNVWAGLVNGTLVGPFILPNPVTPDDYLMFLRDNLHELLENVPLDIRRTMWFLQYTTSLHCVPQVCKYLRNAFKKRVIGFGTQMVWPSRSPDLSPTEFFLWNYMKHLVYANNNNNKLNNIEQLHEKIQEAAMKISKEKIAMCYDSWKRRANLCIKVNGGCFEHLL